MALRVLSLIDIFSDEAHLDHCGLLFLSERVDKLHRKLPIIILPKSRKGDKRTDPEDSAEEEEEEEEDRILFWGDRVERVEHYIDKEFGVICFYFNVKEDFSFRNRVYISQPPLSSLLTIET